MNGCRSQLSSCGDNVFPDLTVAPPGNGMENERTGAQPVPVRTVEVVDRPIDHVDAIFFLQSSPRCSDRDRRSAVRPVVGGGVLMATRRNRDRRSVISAPRRREGVHLVSG